MGAGMLRFANPAVLGAVALSGCAVYDTGEIDYRRVATKATPSVVTPCSSPCTLKNVGFKNSALGTPIQPKQVFSISIDHGLIADMVEPKFAMRRAVQLRNPFRRVGEIVILASAFEFEADTSTTKGFVDFSDLSDAKVIYYHPDVEAHQHLNISNIPLLSPQTYGGRPVGVQIFVIELDRMSKPMQGLLTQLADLGWASNIISPGVGGELLTKLGKSMLSGAHDDTIFEYRFVLDPIGTLDAAPLLESGRYVLVRNQERRGTFDWSTVNLDRDTGELRCVNVIGCQPGEPFNGATYLVLNVKKHPDGAVSAIAQKKYGDLIAAIDKAADAQDARLSDVTTQIKAMTDTAAVGAVQGRVERKIAETQQAVAGYERSLREAKSSTATPSCTLPDLDTQSAETQVRISAANLYDDILAAEPTVGPAGTRTLLGRVARLFLPMSANFDASRFVDLAAFKSSYPDGGKLGLDLVDATKGRLTPAPC